MSYDPSSTTEYRFEMLIKQMRAYHPSADFSKVEKAYVMAQEAHKHQVRKSGEPYIIHPLAVATILAELRSDRESVIAGLLHDVVEDTELGYDDIKREFGTGVAELVNGVTKLDNMEDSLKKELLLRTAGRDTKKSDKIYRELMQAENLRKMFMAVAGDIRVLLVKLADRLHNMRTLGFVAEHKQKEKSQETLEIYCPLAHRLGISKLRTELEDLSFKYLYPEDFNILGDKLLRRQSERQAYIQELVSNIQRRLDSVVYHNHPLVAHVEGRPKHLFSIFKKMRNQDKSFEDIYDLFAIRVLVNELNECYEVLGVIHDMFKPMPGRFKDYISSPKPNGYKSLHTGVIGPEGEDVEIQIRTWDMHRESEYGIAAHWIYKEGGSPSTQAKQQEEKMAWLGRIMEWQRDMEDSVEFLSTVKEEFNVFNEQIYCFTPRGEIISLVKNSSPIDFAYAIHSAVGNKMVGAKVNGSIVVLAHQLKNGDRVEIMTSQNSKGPSRDWLKIVKTSQARTKINQWFRKEDKTVDIQRGQENIEKAALRKRLTLKELLTEERKKLLVNKYGTTDWESLLAMIGRGAIKEGKVVGRLQEEHQRDLDKENPPEIRLTQASSEREKARKKKKHGVIIKGESNMEVRFPKCCNPVPGDEIVGYITKGHGVTAHRTDCINVINMNEIDRQRLIEAEWELPSDPSDGMKYRTGLKIICSNANSLSLIQNIANLMQRERISMTTMNTKMVAGEVIMEASLEISTRQQLEHIIDKLKQIKGVFEIQRVSA